MHWLLSLNGSSKFSDERLAVHLLHAYVVRQKLDWTPWSLGIAQRLEENNSGQTSSAGPVLAAPSLAITRQATA